jgi:hypothetical protein
MLSWPRYCIMDSFRLSFKKRKDANEVLFDTSEPTLSTLHFCKYAKKKQTGCKTCCSFPWTGFMLWYSSGFRRRVDWLVEADVSENCAVSIVKSEFDVWIYASLSKGTLASLLWLFQFWFVRQMFCQAVGASNFLTHKGLKGIPLCTFGSPYRLGVLEPRGFSNSVTFSGSEDFLIRAEFFLFTASVRSLSTLQSYRIHVVCSHTSWTGWRATNTICQF